MKTIGYADSQAIAIMLQAEGKVAMTQLCPEHGMNNACFYIYVR